MPKQSDHQRTLAYIDAQIVKWQDVRAAVLEAHALGGLKMQLKKEKPSPQFPPNRVIRDGDRPPKQAPALKDATP